MRILLRLKVGKAKGSLWKVSYGKDFITWNWEIAGIPLERPFLNYQNWFLDFTVIRLLNKLVKNGILGRRKRESMGK